MEIAARYDVVPDFLREQRLWVLWDGSAKVPLAPWQTDHMFPARWNSELPTDKRPETTFKNAVQYAGMGVERLDIEFGFPEEPPDEVLPTVLVPHEPPTEPPLMFVDLDDVIDPETGEIGDVARLIVDSLDAYTERSQSGTGLHMFVRAALPEHIGRVVEDLPDMGGIEMYDRSRFTGCTWDHVTGTPIEVPERQTEITTILDQYVDIDAQPHTPPQTGPRDADTLRALETVGGESAQTTGARNQYFDLRIMDVADMGAFASYRGATSEGFQGPHPVHGAQSGRRWDSESTNFAVDTDSDRWYCFQHGVGGGTFDLAAVAAGAVRCERVDRLRGNHTPEDLVAMYETAKYIARNHLTNVPIPPTTALRGMAIDEGINHPDWNPFMNDDMPSRARNLLAARFPEYV